MINKIEIYSSSYLIPSLYQFDKKMAKNTKFFSFNDFNIKPNKEMNKLSVYIFFLKDFNLYEQDNYNHLKKKIDSLFNIIELKTKNSLEPFIFASTLFENINNFNLLKDLSESRKLKILLDKKIGLLQKKYKNFYFFDLDSEFSKHGNLNIFSNRNWYSTRCHLSSFGLEVLYRSILKTINKIYSPPKKLLVLDCDNTLWGGVVGDKGPLNIDLGQDGIGKAYQDFQRVIKFYQRKGLLLALCSKNNENDVIEVFKKNRNMVISIKDIVIHKINWNDKSQNIEEIAHELNIGLDSLIFWDDNPIERDKVKKNLPDVHVVDLENDIENWPQKLLNLENIGKFSTTIEDKNKTLQYKNRSKFIHDLKKSKFLEIKYLKSIKLKPSFQKINLKNITRAAQMCEKTNQFNLRTIRFKEKFFIDIVNSEKYFCELVSLKDQYGDHGIVGLYLIKKINKNEAFLENFVMSCRILGRYLEYWMMQRALKVIKNKKIKLLHAQYLPTQKNQIVKNFLKECNFIEFNKMYSIDTSKKVSNFIKIYE